MRGSEWACGVGLALVMVAPVGAIARDRSPSSQYYEREYQTDGPVRGYSGWVGAGPRSLYCDYQRIPNRTCKSGPGGRQRCRVTSWTLKQYCY